MRNSRMFGLRQAIRRSIPRQYVDNRLRMDVSQKLDQITDIPQGQLRLGGTATFAASHYQCDSVNWILERSKFKCGRLRLSQQGFVVHNQSVAVRHPPHKVDYSTANMFL